MPRMTPLFATLAIAAGATLTAHGQPMPETPQLSPAAEVHQRVGLTDVSVTYSSPGVKGRKIFGDLVPYDTMWRTGANKATKISFSREVTFGGKKVPAGDYSLFTIPTRKGWTVVLNSNTELWGTGGYDEAMDVARVRAEVVSIPNRERMTFLFANTTDDGTRLDLEWAKVRVSVPIAVGTKAQVMANIDKAVKSAWAPHMRSAQYLLDHGGDLATATQYVDKSISIEPNWRNHWVKAQILAKQNKKKDAAKVAEMALSKGDDSGAFKFYKDRIEAALKRWK